jgi:hypothetical protein
MLGCVLCACNADSFSSDAGSDGSALDAGDAGEAGDANVPFCMGVTPAPAFCMDFEQGNLTTAFEKGAASTISGPTTQTGGTALLGSDGLGAGDAHFAVDSVVAGNTVDAWYVQPVHMDVVNGLAIVTLQFAWRLDVYTPMQDPKASAYVARIYVRDKANVGQAEAELYVSDDSHLVLTFNGDDGFGYTIDALPMMNQWHTVALRIALLLNNAVHVDLVVDGKTIDGLDNHAAFSGATADFYLGTSVVGPLQPIKMAIDNVVFHSTL